MSLASETPAYRRAAGAVRRWSALYTKDLEPAIAAERTDELASDLHEQGANADAHRTPGWRLAWSVVWRAIAGIPADLSWRYSVRKAADRQAGIGFGGRWERDGSVAVAAFVGVTLLAWGVFVITRMLIGVQRGDLSLGDFVWIPILVSTAAEGCGVALLARRRTRWIGALWLGLGAFGLITFGTKALVYTSATASTVFYLDVPLAQGANAAVVVFACLYFAANAALWFPYGRKDETKGVRS